MKSKRDGRMLQMSQIELSDPAEAERIIWLIVFCARSASCASCALDVSMRNICARFVQDCTYFPDAQYMCNICARLYFFLQCAKYAQDFSYFPNAQDCSYFPQCSRLYLFPQDLRRIVLLSNICARFPQNCTSFSNAQYMCKICARLQLFLQWAIYAQYLRMIVLISSCAIYAQDLRKIVLLSPMRKIVVIDCSYFFNAQYMRKISARFYLTSNLKW